MKAGINSVRVQYITFLKRLPKFVKKVHICRASLISDQELGDGSFFGFDERPSAEENYFKLKILLRASDVYNFVIIYP
jgi:hypothetical protein